MIWTAFPRPYRSLARRIFKRALLALLIAWPVLEIPSAMGEGRKTGDLLYPRSGSTSSGGRIKRSQRALGNAAALQNMMLNINLFPDRKIVAIRDREDRRNASSSVWVGRIIGEPFSRVTITNNGGVIAGTIEMVRYGGSEVYEIAPTAAGDYSVSQVQMAGDVCPVVVPVGQQPGTNPPPVAGDGSTATIDLLVAYTPASRTLYGKAGIEAMIQSAVADANTAYQNSMLNVALNLKAMVETNYTETGLITDALGRLQSSSDGFMDELHALRETHAADVVTLVGEDSDSAGVGYVMTAPSTSFAPYAFNVVYSGALSGLTLPHEIGHHMGCQHNRENASSQGAFPYAYGMRNCTTNGSGFRTVMSYYCNDAPRIPYFSTPNLQYNGIPLGTAYETNPATSSDNARCINATAATIAAFRPLAAQSTMPAPAAPATLAATAISSSQINLSWTDQATDETGLRVYRSTDAAAWALVATLPVNSINFSDTSVAAGTTYYFKVAAYNSNGTSSDSNIASATTPALPRPAAPTTLAATVVSTSQINLSWADISTNEDGFRIERSTDGTTFSALTNVGVNAVSFSDTGLAASTKYYYRVLAYNAGGNSAYTAIASATTQATVPPPTAPTTLALTVKGSFSIALTWADKSTNETGFIVERSLNGTAFTAVTTVGAGVVTFTDTGLTAATKHYYRVAATNAGGKSAYTTVVSATTAALPAIPTAPTTLSVSVVSSSSLKLTWSDKSTNETGFKIERSPNGTTFTEIATVGASVITFSDAGLAASTKYYYRVRAYNDGGNSAYTSTASATTSAPPAIPTAPTSLALTVKSSSQINLSWSDKSSNETGFKIERSTDGVTYTQIATVGASVKTFSNTGLTTKTKYYYRVRAYNAGGNSAYTNVASATTT